MATSRAYRSRRGIWLVIGLVTLGALLVLISRTYRVPSAPDWRAALREGGFPAARHGRELSRAGRELLSVEEQAEIDATYAQARQALTAGENREFEALIQKGDQVSDRELTVMSELVQKALRSLPAEESRRFYALIEKAVRLQLEREQAAADQPAP